MKLISSTFIAAAVVFGLFPKAQAQESAMVTVTIENVSPDNGVILTPAWVGFHNGNFAVTTEACDLWKALSGLQKMATTV
jgi:hypothetical protein